MNIFKWLFNRKPKPKKKRKYKEVGRLEGSVVIDGKRYPIRIDGEYRVVGGVHGWIVFNDAYYELLSWKEHWTKHGFIVAPPCFPDPNAHIAMHRVSELTLQYEPLWIGKEEWE